MLKVTIIRIYSCHNTHVITNNVQQCHNHYVISPLTTNWSHKTSNDNVFSNMSHSVTATSWSQITYNDTVIATASSRSKEPTQTGDTWT